MLLVVQVNFCLWSRWEPLRPEMDWTSMEQARCSGPRIFWGIEALQEVANKLRHNPPGVLWRQAKCCLWNFLYIQLAPPTSETNVPEKGLGTRSYQIATHHRIDIARWNKKSTGLTTDNFVYSRYFGGSAKNLSNNYSTVPHFQCWGKIKM